MIPDEFVNSKIYVIRDKKVMLDRDLAELFNVKAIRLHFMFQLSEEEVEIMVSHFAMLCFIIIRSLFHLEYT